MKKIVLLVVCLTALVCSAFAQDITITTGAKSKTFYTLGSNLSKLMTSKPQVITSSGSMDNLDKLYKNEAGIGFAFADSYALFTKSHKDAANKLQIIGTAGKGCLYVAVNKNGKIKTEDDLQKSGVLVAVGKQGAGANATWDFAGLLDSDYKLPAITYEGDALALNKLSTQALNSIGNQKLPVGAVLQMQNPSVNNKFVSSVVNNPNLELIDFDDYSLNDKLPNGSAVYNIQKIAIAEGTFVNKKINTICTDTLIIANTEIIEEDTMEELAEITLNKSSSILVGTQDE